MGSAVTDGPPRRRVLVAVWLAAVLGFGSLLALARAAESGLDDPDPARQRSGFLDAGGLPQPAPSLAAGLPRPGRPTVVFFLRPEDAPFELVLEHTELGEQLLPYMLVLSIALLALIGLAVWAKRRGAARPSWVNIAGWGIGAVSIVGAVLSIIYVIRIGHSGTEAVWSDLPG